MKNRNLLHSDNWQTPPELYKKLDDEFDFDFDPCPILLTEINDANNGLLKEWGKRNFINPPYSRKNKEAFIKKAIEESKKEKLCVMLLPVSTSTVIFHDYVLPNAKDIRFLRGRVRFIQHLPDGSTRCNDNGQHDSMIVIFDGRKDGYQGIS